LAKPKIVVDHRETSSGVLEYLRELGAKIEVRQLSVGDFVIAERVGIERKTVPDFLQSLIDGRLLSQAKLLSETFERPLLILEGQGLYTTRDIHPNAIRGALAALGSDFRIPVLPTEGEEDTAKMLLVIAKREVAQRKESPLRHKRPAMSLDQLQRFIVEGLPQVSSVLAKRLLEHFKSVEQVMVASQRELMEVQGIGRKKAKEIRRALTVFYRPESSQ
jgi:Fanconi anemia group M protein